MGPAADIFEARSQPTAFFDEASCLNRKNQMNQTNTWPTLMLLFRRTNFIRRSYSILKFAMSESKYTKFNILCSQEPLWPTDLCFLIILFTLKKGLWKLVIFCSIVSELHFVKLMLLSCDT